MATGQKFIGSSAGKDGSIFISSIQNWSSVVVEKFNHEGTFISKLESPLTLRKNPDYYTVIHTDTCTNNAVTLSLKAYNSDKDYAFSHFRFNFDNNQVGAVNEAPLTKKTSPYRFDMYRDLKPIDILFTNDKVMWLDNLETGRFQGLTYERKKIGVKKSSMTASISTLSTIWFKNEFIMTYLHIGFGMGPGRYSSVLERVGFESL